MSPISTMTRGVDGDARFRMVHADRPPSFEANFKRHPDSVSASSKVKLVRYQVNPTANWGPGTKAGGKRKRGKDDEGEQ